MSPEEREKAWKEMAYHLGGILMTARKENTDEWMEYVAREINAANKKAAEIEGVLYDVTRPVKFKGRELSTRDVF